MVLLFFIVLGIEPRALYVGASVLPLSYTYSPNSTLVSFFETSLVFETMPQKIIRDKTF